MWKTLYIIVSLYGMKYIILTDHSQMMNDEDINILYNAADVGLNTCQGEGWGMVNFELGAIGKPNIVPGIGGLLDFFDKDSALLIKPIINLYTDTSADGAPGECQICHPDDFVEAMDLYYADEKLVKKHGENARKNILAKYQWKDIGKKLYDYIIEVADVKEELVDICDLIDNIPDIVETKPDIEETKQNIKEINKINNHNPSNIKERLKAKLEAKKKLKTNV